MIKEELQKTLELYKLYLAGNPDGKYANLQGANLQGADLQGAYLQGAYLRGAYLQGAYLQGANLRGADLQGANLRNADLQGADLQGAYLRGAKNLPQILINLYKKDLLYVLMFCKEEVQFLKEKLIEGKIDGSQYEGECCCLIGTLAVADTDITTICQKIPFYEKGLHNYSEQLFFQIRVGDTSETNQFSQIALETIEFFEKIYETKIN